MIGIEPFFHLKREIRELLKKEKHCRKEARKHRKQAENYEERAESHKRVREGIIELLESQGLSPDPYEEDQADEGSEELPEEEAD